MQCSQFNMSAFFWTFKVIKRLLCTSMKTQASLPDVTNNRWYYCTKVKFVMFIVFKCCAKSYDHSKDPVQLDAGPLPSSA